MAIPLTAVLRIYLSSLDHPLPRFVARKIAGGHSADADGVASKGSAARASAPVMM